MDHLAIMNPKRKLIPKILSGEKTIESRRYMMKVAPWNKIKAGDTVYFKDAAKPVTASATVAKVLQYDHYTDEELHEIITTYGGSGGIAFHGSLDGAYKWAQPKTYCILVFLKHPKKITPFSIDKTGYGNACAWISLPSIEKIRL
ncbi:MAG: ASCH domain-containing protein [candidate division SR1 bacterium]|nr:ASCH domain-containing protein [candidate division SR1 bacterium]